MKPLIHTWVTAAIILSSLLAGRLEAQGAAAQGARLAATDATVPRTPDGRPSLEGFWVSRAPDNPNLNEGIEEHIASFEIPAGKSVIVDPPDGLVPYQSWAVIERSLRGRPESAFDDPELHCLPAGVPRQMYINLHQIIQTPAIVQILYEFGHAYRTIPLDARPHLPTGIRLWEGDSIGHWVGDTLVVDTTNNNGRTWLEQTGIFVSEAAHQIERFTMINSGTIRYEVTIEDPKTLTRPFTMTFSLARVATVGFELLEYACHEDNSDLDHMKALQDAAGGRPKRPQ